MLRSRMFTPLFRLYAGWAGVALVAAFLFAVGSNEQHPFTFTAYVNTEWPYAHFESFPFIHNDDLWNTLLGPITLGWKGSVGNHVGYAVWVGVLTVTAALGGILIAFRDADPEAEAELVQAETVPLTKAPAGVNYWPVFGAFAAGVTGIGWIVSQPMFYAGLGLLAVTAVVWTFRAWAERATGDDEVNMAIYHRFIDPVRIPVLAIAGVALIVFGISRVLLSVSREAAIGVFLGAFIFIALVFTALAFAPKLSKNLVTAIFLVLGIVVLAVGVGFAVKGEREFGHETPGGEGGSEGGGHSGEGGLAPTTGPSAPIVVQVSS